MFKAIWKFITIFKYRVIAVGKVKCVHNGIYLAVYMMNGLGKRKFRFISQKQELRYIQRGNDYKYVYLWKLGGPLPENIEYVEESFDNLIATYFAHKLTLGDKS